MSLLSLIIMICVVGVVLWLVNTYIPMEASVKKILNITVVVILVLWILRILGFWNYFERIHL